MSPAPSAQSRSEDPTPPSAPISLRRVGLTILLVVLVLSPLPYGGFRPWIWPLSGLFIGMAALLWAVGGLQTNRALSSGGGAPGLPSFRPIWPLLALMLPVIVWILLQGVNGLNSDLASPLHTLAAEYGSVGTIAWEARADISRLPEETLPAALRLILYMTVFVLAYAACRDRKTAQVMLWTIVIAAGIQASWGILNVVTGLEKLLWDDKEVFTGVVTGTLVNRNHTATLLGFGLIAGLALLWRSFRNLGPPDRPNRKETILLLMRLLEGHIALIILICLTLFGLAMTLSRGGIAAGGVGLVTLGILIGLSQGGSARIRKRWVMPGSMVLAVGAVVISGSALIERIGVTTWETVRRDDVYALALRAISDNPWLGFGSGSFASVFEQYRSLGLDDPVRWRFAHNSYLENAVEWGVPATLCFYTAIALVIFACIRGVRMRMRDGELPAAAAACGLLAAVHGLVDFSLQAPAVAMILAAVLGMGYAQSFSSRET